MHRIKRTKLNAAWLFSFEGEAQTVDLPHSWNALDTMDTDPERHYRRGIGIYQKDLSVPDLPAGGRWFLEVEAASQKASVKLASKVIADHQGGYTAFNVELTPRELGFEPGSEIPLTIEVDNRPDPDLIPSDMSDFFLYGGLTRNLWLYQTGPLRIDTLHFDIELDEANTAQISVKAQLDGTLPAAASLHLQLFDPQNQVLIEHEIPLSQNEVTAPLPNLTNVKRWSPDHPHLYRAEAEIIVNGQSSDRVIEQIGFRTYDFPAGGPFYLNGERLLLRGTHRHEDWAGCGNAVPDVYNRRELEQIKAAGFNFIRLGHNPQAPAVLQACDELGLIVWEELPWCRGGVGGDQFKSQARAMLREMIDQHYNHPAIIFWGLGNELDWESEHLDSSDATVAEFLSELHDLTHSLDPSRLTALRRFEPGAEIVDVYAPSIWSGWYAGRYEEYETQLQRAMQKYPRMLHMEWGGDSHLGRHNSGNHLKRTIASNLQDHAEQTGIALSDEGPPRGSRDSDWSESYMLDLMEWHLQVQQRLPNLAGTAQWVFKDFGTPLRPENPIPYVNQKGLVDRAGNPKDVYYLFQSYQTQIPVCYIESPSWPIRNGAEDELKRVRVISNCPSVELIVNGESQGTKIRNPQAFPAAGLTWFVPLHWGVNQLQAVGWTQYGKCFEHQIEQQYTPTTQAQPDDFEVYWETKISDGQKVMQATIQLVDQANTPITQIERFVQFNLRGAGRLVELQGTPNGSRVIETANGRAKILIVGADHTTRLSVNVTNLPEKIMVIETQHFNDVAAR